MREKAYIAVIIALLLLPVIGAQTAPPPPADTSEAVLIAHLDQEHKNTRKFFSDELTRQRQEFYTQFDDRAMFYEKEFFDTLNTAVLKLSLIWGAIVFCTVGLSNMLRITLERKRFRRMKETLKDELRTEIFLKNPPRPTAQSTVFDRPNDNVSATAHRLPQMQLSDKDGFFARRKKRKIAKEIDAIEREQRRQETKAAMLRAKIGGQAPQNTAQPAYNSAYAAPAAPAPNFAPPQSQPAGAQPLTSHQIAQMTAQYNQQIMQQYMAEHLAKMQPIPPPPNIPVPPQQLKVEVYH
jgi:hypothetical protein